MDKSVEQLKAEIDEAMSYLQQAHQALLSGDDAQALDYVRDAMAILT